MNPDMEGRGLEPSRSPADHFSTTIHSQPVGTDGHDHATGKRLRDTNWDGPIKRNRRDDHDPGAYSGTQFSSPASPYGGGPSLQFYTPPAPLSSYQQQSTSFPDVAPDFVRSSLEPPFDDGAPSYKEQDNAFGSFPPPQAPQAQQPLWPMSAQQESRLHPNYPSGTEQNQYYNLPNEYVATSLDNQGPFPAAPLNDWSSASFPYTNGFEGWNHNQYEEPIVYGQDASLHLKLQSLSTLQNLSTQIILNLAKSSLTEIMLLTAGRDYEESQAYFTRRTLFDQTRKVFTRTSAFIDTPSSPMFTPSKQEVIRITNKATFISSILEGHDISFFDLDQRFLETFIPTGQRLLKWQGTIFLELKTQAYIAALMNGDASPEMLLNDLFSDGLADKIIARHPDAPNLAPSEQDFLDRARSRRQYLSSEPPYQAVASLQKKYAWSDFLREFVSCIHKNVESIINNPARTPASNPSSFSPNPFGVHRMSNSPSVRYGGYGTPPAMQQAVQGNSSQFGGQNFPPVQSVSVPPQQQRQQQQQQPQQQAQQEQAPQMLIQQRPGVQEHDQRESNSATPDTGRSASAASPHLKSSRVTKAAKQGSSSGTPRQPWKQEEEDALLEGLTQVKGPHWSQILSLYGRGGSISEVLKDRNQIQLKDKARNLKLWYLKMGNEVPVCLRGVTGELRKRGGARVRAALGLTDDEPQGKRVTSGSAVGSPLRNVRGGQKASSSAPQIDPALNG